MVVRQQFMRTIPGKGFEEYRRRNEVRDIFADAMNRELVAVLIIGSLADGSEWVKSSAQLKLDDNQEKPQ